MPDPAPALPECFADMDKVFPMGPEGLRVAPEECLACVHKTGCLKAALEKEHEKAVTPKSERPPCFSDIKKVFPKGPDGLRSSPEECFACEHKTLCLKAALSGRKGIEFENERVDRAHESGNIGFLARWSRKKSLSRRLSEKPSQNK